MSKRKFLRRKIFLKSQLIEITKKEIAELQKQVDELEKNSKESSDDRE